MKKKYLFIINPTAGKGKCSKQLTKIKESFKHSPHLIDIALTERKGHATEISKLNGLNYNIICAVGGDGTINEVVNGLNGNTRSFLGVVPCGSGNDFARTIGLKKTLNENIATILNGSNNRLIDVGNIEFSEKISGLTKKSQLTFINSCGIGFDALVADIMKRTKYLNGFSLYLLSVFRAMFLYNSIGINSKFDNLAISGKKFLIEIGNGKTSGGGFNLNPYADPGDGFLDACIIERLSKLRILKELPKAINGNHVKLDIVKTIKFQNAEIKCNEPVFIHADGEVISKNAYEIKISLEKNKLNVIF